MGNSETQKSNDIFNSHEITLPILNYCYILR